MSPLTEIMFSQDPDIDDDWSLILCGRKASRTGTPVESGATGSRRPRRAALVDAGVEHLEPLLETTKVELLHLLDWRCWLRRTAAAAAAAAVLFGDIEGEPGRLVSRSSHRGGRGRGRGRKES
ncbi:hypothetical protein BHM03_00022949 [Ensete ventricosum]|nr:hypothetical protein BHM03_00022949 [Ensete ventricosum]